MQKQDIMPFEKQEGGINCTDVFVVGEKSPDITLPVTNVKII